MKAAGVAQCFLSEFLPESAEIIGRRPFGMTLATERLLIRVAISPRLNHNPDVLFV